MTGSPRPNAIRLALATWGALFLWNAANLGLGIARHAPPNWLIPSSLSTGALLIALCGMAAGAGFARWIAAAILAMDVFNLGDLARLGAFANARLPFAPLAVIALEALCVIAVFTPASNAWFRERGRSLRRRPWYPFVLAFTLLLAIPAVAIGASTLGFIALMSILYVPAAIFGRPHFMFGIGAGPADTTGVVLVFAFYGFLTALAALVLRAVFRRRSRDEPPAHPAWADRAWFLGGNALLIACAAAMAIPLISDDRVLKDELRGRVEREHAVDEADVGQWPEVSGRFLIDDDGGKYGVRSSGHWRIARGVLEIVAEETVIWDRVPVCAGCGTLKSWRFVLRSSHGSTSGPTGREGAGHGFEPIPVRGAQTTVVDHRMRLPLSADHTVRASLGDARREARVKRTIPPGMLQGYWIGIELDLGDGTYPANPDDVFMFADALAEKGLAPARCAQPRSIADAVERGCHDALAAMLSAVPPGSPAIAQGDADLRRYSKDTRPLQIAVWRNDLRSAALLLEAGADVNEPGWRGYTLLMNAVRDNKADMTALLARHGAKLDERQPRDFDMTALMMAAAEGESRVVEALLQAGADKSLRDRDGHTAYDYAAFRKHPRTAELLR